MVGGNVGSGQSKITAIKADFFITHAADYGSISSEPEDPL